MFRYFLFVLIVPIILSACSTIKTEVSVLDPSYLVLASLGLDVNSDLKEILLQDESAVKEKYKDTIKEISDLQVNLGEAYVLAAENKKVGANTAALYRSTGEAWKTKGTDLDWFKKTVGNRVTSIANINIEVRQQYASSINTCNVKRSSNSKRSDIQECTKWASIKDETLLKLLIERRSELNALNNDLDAYIGDLETDLLRLKSKKVGQGGQTRAVLSPNDIAKLERQVEKAQNALADDIENILGGENLSSDQAAFYVANADDRFWEENYNSVRALGIFGSGSYIIVAKDKNIRLKGLTFDPTQTAALASKVTSQALRIAVSMAGTDLPTESSSADGKPSENSASPNGLGQIRDQVRELESAEAENRELLINLASSIIEKAEHINNKDEYAGATQAIKVTYQAYKASVAKK